MSLSDAINYALESDPRISALADRCRRDMADITAVHADSPEIRIGYEEGEQTEHGWSSGRAVGGSTSSQREYSFGSGQQVQEGTQTSMTDYGDIFDPDQTAIENSTSRDNSEFTGTQVSQSTSRETETSSEIDYSKQQDEGLSVELRLKPANPWALRAERKALRSAKSVAEAELLEEEQDLACDILEFATRIHYHRQMAVIQRAFAERAQSVHDKLFKAVSGGGLSQEDYADGCRVSSSALAGQHRLHSRLNEMELAFRELTGLDPHEVDFHELEAASITPYPISDQTDHDSDTVASLMQSHPSILIADSNLKRSKAEWDLARIANYPWATHLGVGYAWSEGQSYSTREFESASDESTRSSSSSQKSQTEWSESESTETETPSGDFTTQTEESIQTGTSESQSVGSEDQRSWSSGSETSGDSYDGTEWWVEVGIEIPIFEWLSGETRARRRVASAADESYDRIYTRTQHQILNALNAARRNKTELSKAKASLDRQLPELKKLAASAWQQGLTGELESLRIEESVVDMLILLLDCSMRESLARIDVVRASGTAPSLASPIPTVPTLPNGHLTATRP